MDGTPDDESNPNQVTPARGTVRHRGHHKYELKAKGEAAKNYDFKSARPPGKRTTVVESIGHLVKSCLGGGVVAIHESYKQCGLWTSVVLNVILGMAVSYCMYILARSAQRIYGRVQVPAMSYPDLAEASLAIGPFESLRKYSRCFRYAVDLTICVDLFGSCCVYQIMIARTMKQLIEGTDEVKTEGSPSLRQLVATLLIPCILLCMITTLKYLAPFSIAADAIILIVAGSTIYYAVKHQTASPFDFPVFKTVPGLFEFMGVCVFSMEGVGVTLAIENSMEEPKKIPLVLAGGLFEFMGVCVFSMEGVGVTLAIENSMDEPKKIPLVLAGGLFEFMGVCVFSMEGVGVTLAIENSMEEPKKIPLVLAGGLFEFMGVCVFSMEGVGVTLAIENSMDEPKKIPLVLAGGLFEFMGVCVFSMEGVGVTLAIENSMEEPKKIPLVLAGGLFEFMGVCVFSMEGVGVTLAIENSMDEPKKIPLVLAGGLFEFMGVCVFSMEGVGVTLAIENSMEEPKKIPLVLAGGMSVVVSIVMCVGFFGYWGFGEKSKSPVTLNFPLEPFPIALKVCMALMIYVTFALNFWVPFELVWHYIKRRYEESKYWLWERVWRAILVFIITLIAIIFPAVTKFIGLIGSFCLSTMGFIFPAFIELNLDWEDPGLGMGKWRLWKFVLICIFGTILCIVGTYINARELVREVF